MLGHTSDIYYSFILYDMMYKWKSVFLSDVKSEESHVTFDFTISEMTNITDYVIGKGETNLRDFCCPAWYLQEQGSHYKMNGTPHLLFENRTSLFPHLKGLDY